MNYLIAACFIVILGRAVIVGNHSLKILYGTIAVKPPVTSTVRLEFNDCWMNVEKQAKLVCVS